MQSPGAEQPIYVEGLSTRRRHWYTATEGDAVHRFPVQPAEIWNDYSTIPSIPSGLLINDGDIDGVVALRQGRALQLIPGAARKYQYASPPADELRQVITATFGQASPAGDAGPTLSGSPATGYTPVIQDGAGLIHPMQASSWIVDGINHYVEFPYGVPAAMAPPFRLTYFEYTGPTGGGGGGGAPHAWHYVAAAGTPGITLCPNPAFPGPPAAGPSHFVAPLAAQSTEGGGTRLMLDAGKGAVRGGTVTANQWDGPSRGVASAAFGFDNTASGDFSFIGAGQGNTATGNLSVVAGGLGNSVLADLGWAGGGGSTVSHPRSLVWSDAAGRASTANDQVTFGATGGFRVLDGCLFLQRPNATGGGIVLDEAAASPCPPAAGQGTFWVRSDAPNAPIYTDDAGADHNLLVAGADAVALVDGGTFAPHETLVQDGTGPTIATKGLVAGANVVLTQIGAGDLSIAAAFGGGPPPASAGPWVFYDQMAAGLPGGTYGPAGTWQTRVLNLQQFSSGAQVQLAAAPAVANELLLQGPGVYHFNVTSPAVDMAGLRIRLYDVTSAAAALIGASARSRGSAPVNQSDQVETHLDGVFAVVADTVVRVEIYGNDDGPANASNYALGGPANSGDPEIYTIARVYKIG